MKIITVDIKYDYGEKGRGLNAIGQYGFIPALKSLGYHLEEFYFDSYFGKHEPDLLQQEIISFASEKKADFVFFLCMHQDEFSVKTLTDISKISRTIGWFGDDQWRFDNYTKFYAPFFDFCVTTDCYAESKYRTASLRGPIKSQWGAIEDEPQISQSSSCDHLIADVLFVGGWHPYRNWFIETLRAKGISVKAFGHGWPSQSLSNFELKEATRRSKITLNIGNSSSWDSRYITSGIRPLLNTLRTSKSSSQIKARNFEIPYFGGFQLTEYVPGIEKYFQIGSELACFSTIDEAFELIRFYLDNESAREEIKTNGYLRARKEHGYSKRFQDIFSEIACRLQS